MKKTSKNLVIILVLISMIAVFILGSCATGAEEEVTEEAEEVAAPAGGTEKVVFMVRTGTESVGMRAAAEQYTKDFGIEVEILEIGREGFFTTMPTQLLAGTDEFDTVLFPNTMIAEFAEAGVLEPLDDYINNPDLTDMEEFDKDDLLAIYGYKDKSYELPITISAHYLFYRTDLIENPPQTWDEYFELAKNFTKSINPDSPTTWGGVSDCLPPEELHKVFYSYLWTHGGEIFDESGKAVINSPQAIEAAEWYVKFIDAGMWPKDILSWGFPDSLEALQTGELAMCAPGWDAMMAEILKGESEYKDMIEVTLLPGVEQDDGSINRVPFNHGWGLVLNKNSNNLEGAWKFMNYATGKAGGKAVSLESGMTPSRESLLLDEELVELFPFYPVHAETLRISRSEPSVVFYSEMQEINNTALTKIINGEETPKDALDEAASKLQKLVE